MSDPLHDKLHARLDELRREFARGQERLTHLGKEEEQLRATLLRISGAVQVLAEELGEAGPENGPDAPP